MLITGLMLLILATAISPSWPFSKSKLLQNNSINESYFILNNNIMSGNGHKLIHRISIILFLYSIILTTHSLYNYSMLSDRDSIGIYNGLFQFSQITEFFEIFMLILSIIILSITAFNISCGNIYHNYVNNNIFNGHWSNIYPILIILNLLGALLFMKNMDLVSMYITIELQSFAVYIISSINRNLQLSVKSGLNYFLLGGLSSSFILLGSALIYSTTGLTSWEYIYIIHSIWNNNLDYISYIFYIGICIMLIGYLFKIAASPFHNWAPDVYDGVPHVITIWLQVMTKISILVFMLNIIYHLNVYLGWNINLNSNLLSVQNISLYNLSINLVYSYIILFSGVLSLIIGSILGLIQYRIKRLLAYSTISHLGFLLIALFLIGLVQSSSSIESYIFYILQYSLTSCNNLLIIMAFGYMYYQIKHYIKNNDKNNLKYQFDYVNNSPTTLLRNNEAINNIIYIDDLKGGLKISPMLSLCFFISLFSLAGIPPQIGFFGKQMVILSTLENGYLILAILMILMSVISAGYYLRLIKIIYFDQDNLMINDNINYIPTGVLSDIPKEVIKDNIKILNFSRNYKLLNDEVEDKQKSTEYFSNSISFWISLITIITISFILKPSLILNWVHILTLSLYYY